MSEPTDDSGRWIQRFHPTPAAPVRLVCLPHAGGSATFYFPVSRALAGSLDVLSVQYPGRQERRHEPLIDDIGKLADELARVLQPWLDRPVAFFGHSMGSILAFEVALRLEQKSSVSPVHLFASGRRAPSTHRHETVHQRDDDGILAEMKLTGGTDARLLGDDEVLRMIMPTIRGDYRAIETYQAQSDSAVSCPIDALVGDADPKATVDEARAWQQHTKGHFKLNVFPGGHFFLAHHQREINALIRDRLELQP